MHNLNVLASGASEVGRMRKRFDFSLLDVFQERHAAEVRRNKELQVELSG